MIQYWLRDQIKAALPAGLLMKVDSNPDAPTFVSVFYEGGGQPGRYDLDYQDLRYMIWIESVDWGYADFLAAEIYKLLHNFEGQPIVEVEYFDKNDVKIGSDLVKLFKLSAASAVNPLGIDEGKRRFSINFDAKLTMKKEEIQNE